MIWDVTAIGWLLSGNQPFMTYEITDTVLPDYNGHLETKPQQHAMCYVNHINRDLLMQDLWEKLTDEAW